MCIRDSSGKQERRLKDCKAESLTMELVCPDIGENCFYFQEQENTITHKAKVFD